MPRNLDYKFTASQLPTLRSTTSCLPIVAAVVAATMVATGTEHHRRIKLLQVSEIDVHNVKEATGDSNTSKYDSHEDNDGDIFVNWKGGRGQVSQWD